MTTELRRFLEIPYDELELMNLEAKERAIKASSEDDLREHYIDYLKKEKRLKAVTVCFSDIEGRLHMLDYDKKYLINSSSHLTFDGSSIKGFSVQKESDLRLAVDWGTFRWLPTDVFGPGKVIVFGLIKNADGSDYPADFRGRLKEFCKEQFKKHKYLSQVAVECEGFLFRGINAEQNYSSKTGFEMVSSGGYFNSLPRDPLKLFIDGLAEAQRALSFENEKDHPEVAPSQFELNYRYTDAVSAADLVQLYKLTARQVAANMGCTASFLPKPVAAVNGSGMHTNMSICKDGVNIFHDSKGQDGLSDFAWSFVDRILYSANDIALMLNSSVNAFRRLDPHFEAPNQIKASAVDRGSMIRIPLADKKSARIEMRSVAPDANPYISFYSLFKTGLEGPLNTANVEENRRTRTRFLPGNIYDAVRLFKTSDFITQLLGEENKEKFIQCKLNSADRCPHDLGSIIKTSEILFHHDVTNQYLWSKF